MNRYVVQVPMRGTKTFLVLAESGKEALQKVNEGGHPDVEGLDADINWHGRAVFVRLEEKDVEVRADD